MQLKADIKDKLVSILNKISKDDLQLILKAIKGNMSINGVKRLEANVLGVRYEIKLSDEGLKIDVMDPLNREEDSSRLLTYMINAIERAFQGSIASPKRGLVGLMHLSGGHTARLYEKKTIDFLTIEMDGSTVEEVKRAVEGIGGSMIEHLNATWSFEVTPFNGIRIRVAYWQGEEDMPSGAAVLLGEEVKDLDIPIEELITIIEITINRFVLFYRRETGKQPKLFHSLYL